MFFDFLLYLYVVIVSSLFNLRTRFNELFYHMIKVKSMEIFKIIVLNKLFEQKTWGFVIVCSSHLRQNLLLYCASRTSRIKSGVRWLTDITRHAAVRKSPLHMQCMQIASICWLAYVMGLYDQISRRRYWNLINRL